MVEVFENELISPHRQSSKGNQLKWKTSDDKWYKADYLGYEGLVEYVVSEILKMSTLSAEEFIVYDPEQISYKSQVYNGCVSTDIIGDSDWNFITLERLFKNRFGKGLNKGIYSISDHEKRLKFMVESVQSCTGIKDFGIYINKLFTIDNIILNEDRHTHNIAVLVNSKNEYKLCPIFDNGAGLLSDIRQDYPLSQDTYSLMETVKAKTICDDFEEQMFLSEKNYGENIHFSLSHKKLDQILEKANIYPSEERQRVYDILIEQMRKYKYLFK